MVVNDILRVWDNFVKLLVDNLDFFMVIMVFFRVMNVII